LVKVWRDQLRLDEVALIVVEIAAVRSVAA
jgi:hypothetical protein